MIFSWSTDIAHVSRRAIYCARVTKVGRFVGTNVNRLFEEQMWIDYLKNKCGDHSLKGWPHCYSRQTAIQSMDGATMGIPAAMLAPWNV